MADHIDGDKLEVRWDGVDRRVDNRTRLFGMSLTSLVQFVSIAITAGVIILSLRQDMAEMKTSMEANNAAHHEIMMKLVEVQSNVVSLQEQMIYNRDRLDEAITDRARMKQPQRSK